MIIPIELRFKADKNSKSVFRTDKTIKSHDVDSVEFHISIDGLELTENHTAKILSVFHTSKSQVNVDCDIVEGKIIYKPDTNLISRHEHVTNYVYVYHNNQSLDVREFIYTVDLSKIDETSLEVKEVYDQSYADLLADFEQALSDYKDNLPQADSVRADIDEVLNQFSEDSQAKLSLINEAEGVRVQAEGQRESAESSRVQAETQRVSEESSRVSAESERVLAEDERENAEEQRKTDHANRSAELAGKADKVVLKNVIENGDFSDGLTGWLNYGDRLNIESIEDFVRLEGITDASRLEYRFDVNPNDKVYYSVSTRSINVINSSMGVGTSHVIHRPFTNSEDWVTESGIYSFTFSNLSIIVRTVGNILDVRHVIAINLTETFGAGNEPTKEEMDRLIEITGYIDGEYALNNKEMLGYLMKGIREKANKKQEEWITPTLLNGATGTVQYRKNEFNELVFKGDIKSQNAGLQMFIMPLGYRPTSTVYCPVVGTSLNGVGELTVGGLGGCFLNTSTTTFNVGTVSMALD